MPMTKTTQAAIVVVVVVVIIVAAAAVWWVYSDDDDDDMDAREMLDYYLDNYDGGFNDGTYWFSNEDTYSKTSATVRQVIPMGYDHGALTYTVCDSKSDAKAQYEAMISEIENTNLGIGTVSTVTGINAFDGFTGVRVDVQMGSIVQFTVVCFVAYENNVLVYAGADTGLYHPDVIATDDEISQLFNAIETAIHHG